MKKKEYEKCLYALMHEMVQLQQWVAKERQRVVIVFEGRDTAGKGGMIKMLTSHLNPRIVRVAALTKPSDTEQSQWYFQRYVAHLPSAGEIVLFDRSWYNRAGVERVMGFCTDKQYHNFLQDCPMFENMLIREGILLIKYWFSVSDEEQEKRFQARLSNPLKRWKFSDMDVYARSRWVEYSKAKDAMFEHTDTESSPWFVVDAENKRAARLNCLSHILSQVPYSHVHYPDITLPPINKKGYSRPPMHTQRHIPTPYG
ncbi:polyphosphate kinase 2 [Aestuariibacter sp. AA17]|uniref:ADP/GDP-polyphosphate phosphotransferase n=1 Tax=Fluctibacter corallii TaxID=2984329 RepID=A0ABT3AA96_9ALTE|nr:polyphosphate kinase 2 [Aestuariibacter sp. AA17]MCV2885202.1 polyphosphate kinase 2 [Aestuariibacter sp. AA17]